MKFFMVSDHFSNLRYPWGTHSVFGIPVGRLSGLLCGIDELMPKISSETQEKLRECRNPLEAVRVLERFILDEIKKHEFYDPGIAYLRSAPDEVKSSIKDISSMKEILNTEERTLERKFFKYVGLTPRAFIRLSRFTRSSMAMKNYPVESLEKAAFIFGYYDLSHMARDFYKFAGVSPGYFLKYEKWSEVEKRMKAPRPKFN